MYFTRILPSLFIKFSHNNFLKYRQVVFEQKLKMSSSIINATTTTALGIVDDLQSQNHSHCTNQNYPESPERIRCIREYLINSGSWKRCEIVDTYPMADDADLRRSHSEVYINRIKSIELMSTQLEIDQLAAQFDSIFLQKSSYQAAINCVSCVRHLSEQIMLKKYRNAFALIRPPGHHAQVSTANGYCIFNNVSQAAEAAIDCGANRILIFDFDVHHGQGTQQMYYDDDRILYFSIHRYDYGRYWPHLSESNFDQIGSGRGKGYNVNIPLNDNHCTDADYSAIFWNVLIPMLNDYAPDMIIISAGFDSCIGDPLGEMDVTPTYFAHMIYHLSRFAQNRLLVVLEGGYNRKMLPICVDACIRVLLGDTPSRLPSIANARESTIDSILNAISYLRVFWKCFDYYPKSDTAPMHPTWIRHVVDRQFILPDVSMFTESIDQNKLIGWKVENDDVFDRNSIKSCTALAYDRLSERHQCEYDEGHVEHPARTKMIYDRLVANGLAAKCILVDNRIATIDEIALVHDRAYIERLRKTSKMNIDERRRFEDKYNSIYLSAFSFDSATRAVGSLLQCVDVVLDGRARNAFAIIRPPGHHAFSNRAEGFCLLNNVAIAAKYALVNKASNVKRILIIDWDVHHGNGIQNIFEEDDQILYLSLHRYDNGSFFPVNEPNSCTDSGRRDGRGFTVNIAWSNRPKSDIDYLAAFSKIVMPIAYEFAPDLVLVSSGFDAAEGDPLGSYRLSPSVFAQMTHQLAALANGKLILALEGGYNLNSITDSAEACVRVLLDDEPMLSQSSSPTKGRSLRRLSDSAWLTLRHVAHEHEEYWSSLRGFQKIVEPIVVVDKDLQTLSDAIENISFIDGGTTTTTVPEEK